MGGGCRVFFLQSLGGGAGSFGRGLFAGGSLGEIALGLLADFFGLGSLFRRGQFHARAASFGKADGDRLFGGAGAVFAFADVVDGFADEFTSLGGGGFAFALVFLHTLEGLFLGHNSDGFA